MPNAPSLLVQTNARGVATVTLNRPAVLNAFDEELIYNLLSTFEHLAADAAVRVVVLASAGKAFCAGADIGWMRRAAANDFEANLDDGRNFAGMMAAVHKCPKPIIARIQGAAYGGGVGLACAADIAIASKGARFSVSEAKFGILPSVIGPYLVNAIGLRQAKRLALTCAVIDAQAALDLGLIQQVVEEDALDAAVEACVQELLLAGPQAQRHIKALFGQLHVGPITGEVQELTAQTISRVRATDEAKAGFSCFIDKRPPPWAPTQ